MSCAIVLFVDRPFEEADRNIGLVMSAKIRQVSAAPTKDIEVLVIRGYDNIPEDQRRRLKKLRYNVVDASGALASVKARYAYANESRVSRGDPFHEACFLRWLVLEEYLLKITPIFFMMLLITISVSVLRLQVLHLP